MEWLDSLSPSAASFLGSLAGPFLGLIAVLLGALFNAHLNRRRDDRLRKQERTGWETALKVELQILRDFFRDQSAEASSSHESGLFAVPKTSHATAIFRLSGQNLSLFPPDKLEIVLKTYSLIEFYDEIVLTIAREGDAVNTGPSQYIIVPHALRDQYAMVTLDLANTFDSALEEFSQNVPSRVGWFSSIRKLARRPRRA